MAHEPEDFGESLDSLSGVLAARFDARPDEAGVGVRERNLLRHAELTHRSLNLAAAGSLVREGYRWSVACGTAILGFQSFTQLLTNTGWSWWSVTWVRLTLNSDIPLSTWFCLYMVCWARWRNTQINVNQLR